MKLFIETKNRGFTLIELLIVVVILGVLAAVAIPQFTASTDDAKVAALDSSLATMRTAIDMYYQEHGEYPAVNPTTSGGSDQETEAAFVAQLTKFTDADGVISNSNPGGTLLGPYLKKKDMPNDPIKNDNTVAMSTAGTLGMLADTTPADGPGGWKYDVKTGELIVNLVAYQNR